MFNQFQPQVTQAAQSFEQIKQELHNQTLALGRVVAALEKEQQIPTEVLPVHFPLTNAQPSHEDTATLRIHNVLFSCSAAGEFILHVGENVEEFHFWTGAAGVLEAKMGDAKLMVSRGLRLWIEQVGGPVNWFALVTAYPS